MEDSCEDNAKNDTLKRIHKMVNIVKQDEEVSLEYMKIYEKEQWLIEQGRKETQEKMQELLAEKEAEIAKKDAEIARLKKQLSM